MANCRCPIFQAKGTCYHTGYKPEFKGDLFSRVKAAADRTVKKGNEDTKKHNKPSSL